MDNKFDRNIILLISAFSNWSKEGIQEKLQNHVYPKKMDWLQFLKVLFLSLGLGFTVAGIVFFFAYNWASLHKFAKLGIIQFLIATTAFLILFLKSNYLSKALLTTFLAVLIGVLYAVFGQIYQTGANAYDFFLNWTLSILLLAIFTQFSVLWLIFILLVQTTILLYNQQVAQNWSQNIILMLHVSVFLAMYLINTFAKSFVDKHYSNNWFKHKLALAIGILGTLSISLIIVNKSHQFESLLLIYILLIYGAGIYQVFHEKKTLNLAIIGLSFIVCFCVWFVEIIDIKESSLLLLSFFIILIVGLLSKLILYLNKLWNHESIN
jgi:uncharacterized membrane protein